MLNKFTTNELLDELKKRKIREQTEPVLIEIPNLSHLKSLLKNYIHCIENGNYNVDQNNEYKIFETVLKTFFGEDVFIWINKKLNIEEE